MESLHGMGSEALLRAGRMTTDPKLSPDAQRLLGTMVPCSLSLGDVNDKVYHFSSSATRALFKFNKFYSPFNKELSTVEPRFDASGRSRKAYCAALPLRSTRNM